MKSVTFYYNLFFVFLIIKGTATTGIGSEMTWFECFLPLFLAFISQIAEGLGYYDILKLWVLEKVIAFRTRRAQRRLYRDLTSMK